MLGFPGKAQDNSTKKTIQQKRQFAKKEGRPEAAFVSWH